MIIINPSCDGVEIYDGNSLTVISNKNINNVNLICDAIISLFKISKQEEFGIVSASIGIVYYDYFKSKGYAVKDMKVRSIKNDFDRGEQQMILANKEELFNTLGVSVYDNNGQLRSTYDILRDLAEKWKDFDDKQEEYYSNKLFKLF